MSLTDNIFNFQVDVTNCYTSFHSPYCELKCNQNTCLNGGVCVESLDEHSVQCSCPEGFSGPLCEQSVTSCVPIQVDDHCNHTQPLWYFDPYTNQCKTTVSGIILCLELIRTNYILNSNESLKTMHLFYLKCFII